MWSFVVVDSTSQSHAFIPYPSRPHNTDNTCNCILLVLRKMVFLIVVIMNSGSEHIPVAMSVVPVVV
jgi:hypothetical protein